MINFYSYVVVFVNVLGKCVCLVLQFSLVKLCFIHVQSGQSTKRESLLRGFT